ncbi:MULTISPECIES: hypothetical protein [Bizionia]|uniref:Uncharacterized protein n=1 Tax=Bizionia algoritergicola TaxID=291187 RepID=A0A5D0QX29_9FLAO|nr:MULTISPECIES: hypothetical protein [Bizionia]OBX19673.1 hypothetical protein BAA08_15110 [Bizionia sp. APA-3]TYB73732.1 hypothetical protein ES675_08785 [Bizionia algoritergicola]
MQQHVENIYVFTSIFTPTEIKKSITHSWKWHNNTTKNGKAINNKALAIIILKLLQTPIYNQNGWFNESFKTFI